ncbi:MAG TPA: RsmE family RNA methyltransferase [Bacillota bacterium]|nr:RsmE family RNA methyltransferase [Bacillota bacterium]
MPRYFYGTVIDEERFRVTGEEAHHLTHVMRKTVGDSILINDGKGRFYNGLITESANDAIVGEITEIIEADVEPMTRIILCQALPKGDKMEEIIRKGTEIGVAEFLPFISKRSISRPDDHGMERRLERWKRIAEEAAKQAGRAIVPDVHPIGSWKEVLELAKQVRTFVAWEGERSCGLRRVFDGEKKDPVAFIVGPEGGLDPSEITKAEEYGVESVSLGPRILRTETAGPVLAALALYARDEMEPVNG